MYLKSALTSLKEDAFLSKTYVRGMDCAAISSVTIKTASACIRHIHLICVHVVDKKDDDVRHGVGRVACQKEELWTEATKSTLPVKSS